MKTHEEACALIDAFVLAVDAAANDPLYALNEGAHINAIQQAGNAIYFALTGADDANDTSELISVQ